MFMDKPGNISMNSPHRGSIGWDSTCAVCASAGAMQASNRRRRLLVSRRQAGLRLSTLPHLAFASLRSHSLAKVAAAEKAPCLHLPPAAAWCFFPRRSIHYRSRSNPIYAKNMSPHKVGAHIFGAVCQRSLAIVRAFWYNGKKEDRRGEEWNSGNWITGETW